MRSRCTGGHRCAVKSLGVLTAVLVSLALAAIIAGVLLLVRQNGWELELAKWLLTLGVGLLTAGAVAGVYKLMDLRESRIAVWRAKLADLTAAYDAVQKARMRMIAHQSARAYSLEMENLVGARELLRRTFPEGEVDADTRAQAEWMWKYIEDLGLEYQADYFGVSRQQRADEAALDAKIKRYVEGDAGALDSDYFDAPGAYKQIEAFPKYGAFIDPKKFETSAFVISYKTLRDRLRLKMSSP